MRSSSARRPRWAMRLRRRRVARMRIASKIGASGCSPMVFTRRHERELGEIKRLARQLRNDLQRVKRELDRIEAATGPLVAFIHIPKTAGGTAKDMLMRAYSRTALHNAGNYLRDPE